METRLRRHIGTLFEDAPKTRKAFELQEEMIQNLTEKYHDLLAEGKSEEVAYNIAVSSIGDIRDLLRELDETPGADPQTDQAWRRKSALRVSIAVMMYILSVIPIILFDELFPTMEIIGLLVMFVMVASATGLIIYNSMTKPKRRAEDTVVEEFREWQAHNDSRRSLRKAISSVIWSLTLVLYFIISFTTGAWHITWLLFLIAAAIEQVVRAVIDLSGQNRR